MEKLSLARLITLATDKFTDDDEPIDDSREETVKYVERSLDRVRKTNFYYAAFLHSEAGSMLMEEPLPLPDVIEMGIKAKADQAVIDRLKEMNA